jgi:hypothetical protein
MENVRNAHVSLGLKPIKVIEIGRRFRQAGRPYVILELPDGKRIPVHEGDTVDLTASFDFNENDRSSYTVE